MEFLPASLFGFPKFSDLNLMKDWVNMPFGFGLFGFFVSFIPLYLLGFMGATRRLDHYDPQQVGSRYLSLQWWDLSSFRAELSLKSIILSKALNKENTIWT